MLHKVNYSAEDYVLFFQKGEERGFAWFFDRFYAALTMYGLKMTGNKEASEEMASNAFMKIWHKCEGFSSEPAIKAYLYRIVHNDALKYLNKQKQLQVVDRDVIYLYGGEHEKDHFDSIVTAETSRELLEAINDLPSECSKVFHHLYVEGKSIQETAEELNLSSSTVKTQKKRGLDALRKRIAFLWSLFP